MLSKITVINFTNVSTNNLNGKNSSKNNFTVKIFFIRLSVTEKVSIKGSTFGMISDNVMFMTKFWFNR